MRSYVKTEQAYERRCLLRRLSAYAKIIAAISLAALTLVFWSSGLALPIHSGFLRLNFQLRGPITPPPGIIIVSVGSGLRSSHLAPFPRAVHAELLEKIASLNPRALFIDVLFVKDENETLANERIAAVLARFSSVISSSDIKTGGRASDSATILLAEPTIESAAKTTMRMQFSTLNDKVQYIRKEADEALPRAQQVPIWDVLRNTFQLSAQFPDGRALVNYYGDSGTIPSVLAEKLLTDDPARFADKIRNAVVFYGTQNFKDGGGREKDEEEFSTTYSSKPMYGVEVHATIAANLLKSEWIRSVDPRLDATLLLILVFISSLSQFFLSPKRAYLIFASLMSASLILTHLFFVYARTWLSFAPTLLIFGLLSIFIAAPLMNVVATRFTKLAKRRTGFGG